MCQGGFSLVKTFVMCVALLSDVTNDGVRRAKGQVIRWYLRQTEVTISIPLFDTDRLCLYLLSDASQTQSRTQLRIPRRHARCNCGRAEGTKSPFTGAKQETAIQHASSSSMFWSQFCNTLRTSAWGWIAEPFSHNRSLLGSHVSIPDGEIMTAIFFSLNPLKCSNSTFFF